MDLYLHPNIKSIQRCMLFDTYSLSKAALCFLRKSYGDEAQLGSLASSTLFPLLLTPKSNFCLLTKKSGFSRKNSGISSLTLPGLVFTLSHSLLIPLNSLLGLSNFPP